MKRFYDILFSSIGIIFLFPLFTITFILIFLNDFNYPLYTPLRMGKNMKPFMMIKFRSMSIGADKSGVNSTSSNDNRLTTIGKIIRRFKIDELSQLFNVFFGTMSLVGPRPQVVDHVLNDYNCEEKKILNVKPGITDFSSIVFSDEGDILKNSSDPDNDYNRLIRPWKSKLCIFYIENRTLVLDFKLVLFTVIALISKKLATTLVSNELKKTGAKDELVKIAKRNNKLIPTNLPGSKKL